MAWLIEVMSAIEREREFDLLFVDSEFARLPFKGEHIRDWARTVLALSYAVVPLSEGAVPFYAAKSLTKALQRDCSEFVVAEVLPHMEAADVTCRFSTGRQFQRAWSAYFAKRWEATRLPPLLVTDWIGDAMLVDQHLPDDAHVLLLDELPAVQRTFEGFFTGKLRRHNAVHDAMALRQGYINHKAELAAQEGA
ncbi:MAG: hypothetical protein NTW01_03520 [Gammaproteobacteria bacterium]|nr:hypothetical protein [Gammaproteobacteria bacterium]